MNMKPAYKDEVGSSASIMFGDSGTPHTIVWITVPDNARRSGYGTALLEKICADADKDFVELIVRPEAARGERSMNVERLRSFFSRAGFKSHPDLDGAMKRPAAEKPAEEEAA